jgi:hypothetical protein
MLSGHRAEEGGEEEGRNRKLTGEIRSKNYFHGILPGHTEN